ALCRQVSGLLNHGVNRPAAESTPDFWNDAEGAGVIATLGDLDVGGVAGRAQCARGCVIVQVEIGIAAGKGSRREHRLSGYGVADLFDLVGSENGINLNQVRR